MCLCANFFRSSSVTSPTVFLLSSSVSTSLFDFPNLFPNDDTAFCALILALASSICQASLKSRVGTGICRITLLCRTSSPSPHKHKH
jgi:hypothetical protein